MQRERSICGTPFPLPIRPAVRMSTVPPPTPAKNPLRHLGCQRQANLHSLPKVAGSPAPLCIPLSADPNMPFLHHPTDHCRIYRLPMFPCYPPRMELHGGAQNCPQRLSRQMQPFVFRRTARPLCCRPITISIRFVSGRVKHTKTAAPARRFRRKGGGCSGVEICLPLRYNKNKCQCIQGG